MRPTAGLLSLLLLSATVDAVRADDIRPSNHAAAPNPVLERGRAVYESRCISCHGVNGTGTTEVPAPIFGDRPTSDLADLVTRTMPEGSPDDCAGDDARAVAEWMQQQFFSPEAQARLNPPRIELSRLTVSQYRNAIADLGTSFRWRVQPGAERGLKAEYFNSRHFAGDKRVIERIDPVVNFNFGEAAPEADKFETQEFSIRWKGSLIPRETGTYELAIHTENGARLKVNDNVTPLIDVWVRSGTETEFTGSRFLIEGRVYPIELEWFKFKEPTSSVSLFWKSPHGVKELIPAANLIPENSPPIIIVETPFPPDDRSSGYERGSNVSKGWDEATTYAAIEIADKIVAALPRLIDEKGERNDQLRTFAVQFVERAFRRPLSDEIRKDYIDSQFAAAKNLEDGIRRIVLLALKSPRFLYREPTAAQDQYDRASRLSFALLNSVPDPPLLDAAKNGNLAEEKQIRDQAWRLVNDYRGRARMLEFLRNWMNLERLQQIDKDRDAFPDFTPELASDMRTSLELMLQQMIDAEGADFQRLLLTDTVFMNARMAEFYGVDLPEGAPFQEVKFEPEKRAGIISHPFILSGFAYMQTSSPIHRGVFMSRGILGRGVKPPPLAVAPTAPDLAPDLTTRERVTIQTGSETCANCHGLINSLGFALENFDAVGRYRDVEKQKAIDPTGQYLQRNGELVRFAGARELAAFMARSEETHRSFARQLFHHMVQQPILAYGPDSITELSAFFRDHQYNMKHLAVEIACRSSAQGWTPNSEPVAAAEPE
jgi:cytochrome c5